MAFLRTRDGFERTVMNAVGHEAAEMERQRDEDRAKLIADAVSKRMFGR